MIRCHAALFSLLTCMPSYLNHVLKYDIAHAGFIAGLPERGYFFF